MWFAYIETDYLAPKLPSLLHYWSLGLEELILSGVAAAAVGSVPAAPTVDGSGHRGGDGGVVRRLRLAHCRHHDLPKAFFWLPPACRSSGLGADDAGAEPRSLAAAAAAGAGQLGRTGGHRRERIAVLRQHRFPPGYAAACQSPVPRCVCQTGAGQPGRRVGLCAR